MAGQVSASVPALSGRMHVQSSKAILKSSSDLIRIGATLNDVPADELFRIVTAIEAELTRAAGTLVGQALERIVEAYPLPKDLANPQAFIDQAVLALEDFPEIVIRELADPKIGIVRDLKFFPRIADLVKWCEARIARYRLACNDAREELAHRDREVTIRQLREEAAAAARAEQAREEAAKLLEPKIMVRLRKLPIGTATRQPRIGEERAAYDWQSAMAGALSRRPDLVEHYFAILVDSPELVAWATERENAYRGSGWPDLGHRLCAMFVRRDTE